MNISVYLNDGKVISSIGISGATNEEALTAIRAFGFGENKEKELDTRRSIGRQLLELEEERDEWKEKYKIECQHNDGIKMANDVLTKNFEALAKDRDAWKEMYKLECQHNDEIKIAYDQLAKDFNTIFRDRDEWRDKSNMLEKECASYNTRCMELIKERDEYKEIASDRDDLKIENDKVKELCDMLQNEKDELQKRFDLVREDYYEEKHKVSELKAENDKLKTALVGARSTCATLEQDTHFWKDRWEKDFNECVKLKKELEKCQEKSES